MYNAYPCPPAVPTSDLSTIGNNRFNDFTVINQYIFGGSRNFSDPAVPLRILVAGCGTGQGVLNLAAQVAARAPHGEIVALDISAGSLDMAKRRLAKFRERDWDIDFLLH